MAQTRSRLARVIDARVKQPAGQPPRCRRPPDPQRTPGRTCRVQLQSANHRQRRQSSSITTWRSGTARRPQLAPAIQRSSRRTGTRHAPSPPTALRRGIRRTRVPSLGVRHVAIPRQTKPSDARHEVEHGEPSATTSNGGPYPTDASTAPNLPASTESEPGADTASSLTISSRSAPSHSRKHHLESRPTATPTRISHRRSHHQSDEELF
jgi:hypothetical protein